jgi:hypothetical protein
MATQETLDAIKQIIDNYRNYITIKAAQAAINNQFHAGVKRQVQGHFCGGTKCYVKKNALCSKDGALATAVYKKWDRITGKRNPATIDPNSTDPVEIYAAAVTPLAIQLVPACKQFDKPIRDLEKVLEGLVKPMAITQWVDNVPGFTHLGLAKIIAEAGNEIGLYRNPSCLWKRFGLGLVTEKQGDPMVRQQRRKGKDLALIHGFCPTRRALMFVIQGTVYQYGKAANNEFYQYAVDVKERAEAEHKDWSKAHVFMHQRRLLAKRLLRELWVQWRKCM